MARSSLLCLMLTGAIIPLVGIEADAHGSRGRLMNNQHGQTTAAPIGTATKEADGTIVLTLRAEGQSGAVGNAQLRYYPTDKDYDMIVRHVSPIPKGKSVPVAPFDS